MVPVASKRPASRSPAGERATKRPATSSPEEGELNDPTPPKSTPLQPSLPPKPVTSKLKVPFPFKKKAEPTVDDLPEFKNPVPVVYERPDDLDRQFRESDAQRRRGMRPLVKVNTSDHWEPSYGNRADSRHYSTVRRDFSSRDYRERDRSPLPRPRTRSPSPSTPLYREKHRLPTHRSPVQAFSPPARHYSLNNVRHRDWDRDDRSNDYRRYRDDDDDERYYNNKTGEPDRYYRPQDDRDWTRREDSRDDRGRRQDDRYSSRRDGHPPHSPAHTARSSLVSPVPVLPRPASSSSTTKDPDVPRPPSVSPPPPPPPDVRLTKDQNLLQAHEPVSITIQRPPAPKPPRSPLPLNSKPKEKESDLSTKVKEERAVEFNKLMSIRRREPVRRSRKEEAQAYGRSFLGCGLQSDYQVTTKLGEGTFGEVHKAFHKDTSGVVALKRILMHNEKEGMPVTALREIKILKALKHPCIVQILDMFVVRSSEKDPLSVYMVFPYMDHDLAGLLENERVKLQPSQIKLYMKQLLEGTEYMHRNHILHRDMKAANLLISNTGSLQIADFGLARTYDANIGRGACDHRGRERKYTNCVVTRWYRPPELLLGARQYGGEVDIWGIGCVLGEMFMRRPILPGNSDLDQLEKIWQLCGSPNQLSWPNFDALPGCEGVKRFNTFSRKVKQTFDSLGAETYDLMDKLLVCNPKERMTASQALDHEYFWTDPLPADPRTLPSYEASHEFDKRGHRNQHPIERLPVSLHPEGHRLPHPVGLRDYRGRAMPPPRESFHNGPPNNFPPHGRGGNQPPGFNSHGPGPGLAGRHALPPQGMPRGSHGHGHAPYPPNRPGPSGPRGDRRQPHSNKPAHLPEKPVNSLGAMRGGPSDGPGPRARGEPNRGGGELNYG